ncbi:hypothetical protein DL769_011144 [Monosporascus sp. CRB-8-3]|nr:hypothetical protein DL769_011144 [Monosporascus sp. CRB-8-3]
MVSFKRLFYARTAIAGITAFMPTAVLDDLSTVSQNDRLEARGSRKTPLEPSRTPPAGALVAMVDATRDWASQDGGMVLVTLEHQLYISSEELGHVSRMAEPLSTRGNALLM